MKNKNAIRAEEAIFKLFGVRGNEKTLIYREWARNEEEFLEKARKAAKEDDNFVESEWDDPLEFLTHDFCGGYEVHEADTTNTTTNTTGSALAEEIIKNFTPGDVLDDCEALALADLSFEEILAIAGDEDQARGIFCQASQILCGELPRHEKKETGNFYPALESVNCADGETPRKVAANYRGAAVGVEICVRHGEDDLDVFSTVKKAEQFAEEKGGEVAFFTAGGSVCDRHGVPL